jgi:hypothetical protein
MHRYHRLAPKRREALGKFYGAGPRTFYARFKRYKIPEHEPVVNGKRRWWALLTTVMDEDCVLLTDHLWVLLPPSRRYCLWALEPRTVLRIEAEVGRYETVRYDPDLCKLVDLIDYCFDSISEYEPIKHFPVVTPLFEREAAAFFEKLLEKPELVQKWNRRISVTGLPNSILALGNVKLYENDSQGPARRE